MIKLAITLTILIATLFAPIIPQPAALHFKPGTPIATALPLIDHLDGEQFSTTWLDHQGKRWYTAHQWHNRHPANSNVTEYHPGETITKLYLTSLSSDQQASLEQSPLIQQVETYPTYLVNTIFFAAGC